MVILVSSKQVIVWAVSYTHLDVYKRQTFSFSAIVVVGNEDGIIGLGLGKAGEVTAAIAKGVEAAKKNLTRVPVLKGTVPVSYTHLDKSSEETVF